MKIGIVGIGALGVTAGIRLLEAGHKVKLFSRDDPGQTTSSVAAAYWDPVHEEPPDRSAQWIARSLEVYQEFAREPLAGIDFVPFMQLFEEDPCFGLSPMRYFSALPATELPAGAGFGYQAEIARIDVPIYYPHLLKRLETLGGSLQKINLGSLDEVAMEHDLIVNCSGAWASRLASDKAVYPVSGQVIRVKKPAGLDSTIWCAIRKKEITYVVPRRNDCVLGGTKVKGDWNLEPDTKISAGILERCQKLVPQIKDVSILEHRVGLRAGREGGARLELGRLSTEKPVIHNYGHGAAGWTLAWGCAEEVVDLVCQSA